MKFFIDNNLPIPLARALNELSEPKGFLVSHLSDKFPRNTPDIDWIYELKNEGEWIVVSQDLFRKNKLEKEAFYRSNLIIFTFPKSWSGLQYWPKASKMVSVWPRLIEQANLIQGGAVFEVSITGKLQQVKL